MNPKSRNILLAVLAVFVAINVYTFFFARTALTAQAAYDLCKTEAQQKFKITPASLPDFAQVKVEQVSSTVFRWSHQGTPPFQCTVTGSKRSDARVEVVDSRS